MHYIKKCEMWCKTILDNREKTRSNTENVKCQSRWKRNAIMILHHGDQSA